MYNEEFVRILFWILGGAVALLTTLIGVIYYDLRDSVKKIMETSEHQPILCQAHKDKLNELIRRSNQHERQIIKYKYAVVDCINAIFNLTKKKIEITENHGTPDIIEGLP